MNLHSSLRGLTLAVGGLLVLAGVALAASGSSGRADDDAPSPTQTAVATFGAVLEAEPTARATIDDEPTPTAGWWASLLGILATWHGPARLALAAAVIVAVVVGAVTLGELAIGRARTRARPRAQASS